MRLLPTEDEEFPVSIPMTVAAAENQGMSSRSMGKSSSASPYLRARFRSAFPGQHLHYAGLTFHRKALVSFRMVPFYAGRQSAVRKENN